MTTTITHKHLKRQLDILEKTEELGYLFEELRFSTLLLPVSMENDTLVFPMLRIDDKNFAPVFTDIHEYDKCNVGGDYTLTPYGFDFYLDLLDERIDGIIIDVEGERFPLTKEIRKFIEPNYIFDYDPNVFTMKEIKRIRDDPENEKLEEFLGDESNFWDFETLLDILLMSDSFNVVLSDKDLSDKVENGVISLHCIGQLPVATTLRGTESYALVYSSESEIMPKNDPMHPYLQLVNMSELISKVLSEDLDGIVLNENTQNITIPREALLDFMNDFRNPRIDRFDDYAFPLDF